MTDVSAKETLQTAYNLHRAGKWQEAQALYKQILTQNPNQADAMHYLGVLAHQMGQGQKAIELIQRSIQLNWAAPHYYNNLGNVWSAGGEWERAVACYRKAI